mgnify:FL=1
MLDIIKQLGSAMQPPIYQQPLCLQSQGREFIELLGKSHVLNMLFFMSRTKKPMRFNHLKREIGITATTLARRLDEMINQGLVDREVFAEVPARVEYELSEKGRTLGPILKSVFEWVGSNNS